MASPSPESFEHAGAGASPPQPIRAPSARDVAHRAVAAQARRFPDLLIAPPDTSGLDARDAALAYAIYDAVIRRWLTLKAILDTRLRAPLETLEPRLQAVLLCGAAQLLLLDRLPDHAVLNEAVEWAKRAIRPGAGAMVNAVLRRVAGLRAGGPSRPLWTGRRDEIPLADGSAPALTEEVMPADPSGLLAAATSHGPQLIQRWVSTFGPDRTRALALHGLINPPTILNTRYARSPVPSGILTPHSAPGHHVFTGDHAGLIALLEARPDIWVQDPASAAAIGRLSGLQPRVIVDACAGQGTKTRQLAGAFPKASIVATDTDEGRLSVLRAVMAGRQGVTVTTPKGLRERWSGKADLILLDVPCSNTGVLARRAEARYRVADSLERLAGVQRQIIADSIVLLAPGGAILYSTCSLEPEENEAQGAWAHRWHRYRVRDTRMMLPAGSPGGDPREYSDGSFSCLMRTG